jgi:hypothetical protein
MIVLCYGVTKSGSTLAFELCKSVLQQKGFEQRRLSDDYVAPGHHVNFLNDLSLGSLQKLVQGASASEIIAVKAHAAIGPAEMEFVESAVAQGQMKVQVNLRDPREVCLSLEDAGKKARENNRAAFAEIKNLEDAAKVVSRQLNICQHWGSIKGALYLFYNEVAFETPLAVNQLCADFGFEMFDAEQMKAVIDRVFNEAFTQRNKAVKDRYKDDLTVRQNEALLEMIKGGPSFIRRVCEQKDFGWFQRAAEIKKRLAS